MGKVYKNGIVSPKGFDMAAGEPVDQREIVESLNDLTTLPHTYPGIEVKVVGEQYKEYKLIRTPSGDIANWIEVVPEYNQPAQQTTDTVLNNSNLPGTTTTEALNSLAFGATGTYEEIKAIRDGGRLTPGSRYTITDYQTKYFIDGSNSSGLVVNNTLDSIFDSSWLIFEKGFDFLIETGTIMEIKSLPEGYTGPVLVGDTAAITDIFDNYYFRVDSTWGQEGPTFIGTVMGYALDRYTNIPNDTVTNDGNGRPVMIPGGIINTDVHDGTDYMDQTAAENYSVPVETIVLVASSNNSFQPQGFSGTFLGDTIYYDMDDTDILNDNQEVIGTRNGRIFRRVSLDLKFDLECDWRVQRNRRYLLNEDSRKKFINTFSEMNAGTPGNLIIGATYIIRKTDGRWTSVGAPDNNVGTQFVATSVGNYQTGGGQIGYADRIFLAGDLSIGETYDVNNRGDTDFTLIGSNNVINATEIAVDDICKIVTVGDTDYTLIGSPDNNVGTIFTATGVGIGTGTVDNGNTFGSRFEATGVGTGTGGARYVNQARNTLTGDSLYTVHEFDTDQIDYFYTARVPEEAHLTVDRWGDVVEFEAVLEANNRAKDFYTIPIDSSYNPVASSIERCSFKGTWYDVIIGDLPGNVYNIDTNIAGEGSMQRVYFPAGLRAGFNSSMTMSDVKSLDWMDNPTGIHGAALSRVQMIVATFFQGSSAGSSFFKVIIGGGQRPTGQDNSSYSWFVFTDLNSVEAQTVAFGTRLCNVSIGNSKIENCSLFFGGKEIPGSQSQIVKERHTMTNAFLTKVVMQILEENEFTDMTGLHTERTNSDNPRGQFVWTRTTDLKGKALFRNASNNALLSKTYDVDNVETINVEVESDNR